MRAWLVPLALLMLFGCLALPIVEESSSVTYVLKADGALRTTQITEGTLTPDAEDWPADCTTKLRETIDSLLTLAQTFGGGTAEEMETFRNVTQALQLVKNRMTCSFRKSGGKGTLEISTELSQDDQQRLQDLLGKDEENTPHVDRNPDATFTFKAPVMKIASERWFDEIRIIVEGEVINITPGYELEGNAYVYRDPAAIQGDFIEVTYRPKAQICPGIFFVLGILAAGGFVLWRLG